ncbi:MAG: IS110 family transposase [Bacteroidales bacterium]|nr:IS110 family transposase [Bacteroidales bacterium]MCF8352467.1 IS110 family transposase [Bacteroidales bacterium]MCF8375395.1 IS110 family transposase [Bacteroidales bacterium]MCF8401266.1 IS110 family transposase [Bacteroidales bacterium]
MKKIRKNAAGIDIGAKKVFVYVEDQEVKSFYTFTEDFEKLRDYLLKHNVESVAMEATGVYWNILYEILEEAGLDVWLVDGRQTRQAPGRKTDVKDCQWIQELHSYGILKRSFVVKEQIKELRSYQRLREDHIRSASMHVNHMQKALTEMNLRIKEVISQIHGVSGLRMIKAILDGERNKEELLKMCDKRIIKNKGKDILKALNGRYTNAGLFALKQAYEGYEFYQNQIAQCDKQIERIIHKMGNKGSQDKNLSSKRKPVRHNKPDVKDLGANLLDVFDGKDATVISGITDYSWMQLLSEVGTDLSNWQTPKHFTSWLSLAPGQHWSGKMKRHKRKRGHPKAGQIFRTIAQSLIESKNIALGAFGRRLRAKKGPAIAIKAVARKLAETYWRVMVKGIDYAEIGIKQYEEQLLANKRKSLDRLAKELNVQISNKQSVVV